MNDPIPDEAQIAAELRRQLEKRYGADSAARVVRSPLRVCPLGAHVDHQLGLVTGFALDKAVWVAFQPRADRIVRGQSLDYPEETRFALDDIPMQRAGDWGNYARGAAQALMRRYPEKLQRGMDFVVTGTLPTGGLGSSAAVGVAYLLALQAANGFKTSGEENIRLDQAIENKYLGLRNGILDQSMTLLSRRGELLLLDCRDASWKSLQGPDPADFRVLIAYSGYSDALVGTDYNRRVEECREAAALLLTRAGRQTPHGAVLRDVDPEIFDKWEKDLPPALSKRARHFFTEVQRVRDGVEAWKQADLKTFGERINASGKSSIENYECGRPELITLYEILISTPGILGARFSGAGFRGSSLAPVETDKAEEARESILARYREACPDVRERCEVFICKTDNGAEVL